MKPLRILHAIDKLSMDGIHPSSCTLLFGDWLDHFDPEQFELAFCTFRKPDPAGALLEKRGARVHSIRHGSASPRTLVALGTLIDRERPDLLHLHGYGAANFGRILSRQRNIPNVVHEHAILEPRLHQRVADWLLRSRTDAAVAISEGVKRFMIEGRSIPPERIRVIPNGVDLRRFTTPAPARVTELRERLGVAADQPLIGTVTRLREEKGNEYLLRALPQILAGHPRCVLRIAGDGPLRSELEALARELGVADRVGFLGHVDGVPELMACFDVFVVPSLIEGGPLVLPEAMAVGSAIVASRAPGIVEIAEDRRTALLVPPADPASLAIAVEELLGDAALRESLAANARKASVRHGIERNVEAIAALYRELASQPAH